MMVWIQFAICTAIIMYGGSRLSKYGDIIAEKTGLGRTWIGIVLLASVTSLPELMTGVSSVAFYNLPDIAVGDVLGSCMFNLLILAVLDAAGDEKPNLLQASQGQTLAAACSVLLLAIIPLSLSIQDSLPALGWVGIYSVAILVGYLWAMWLIFKVEQRQQKEDQEEEYGDISKKSAFLRFGAAAVVVIAAASWLPRLGERITEMTGLQASFVGTLFIALSTSLPELVVTYSAVRKGAINLAVGNIFGSNLFNIAILAIDDLFFTSGPILSHVEKIHGFNAASAIFITAIALTGLAFRSRTKHLRLGLESIAIIAAFCALTFISYLVGGRASASP